MKKLLMLAGLLGICTCSLFVRPAQATFPPCSNAYCTANPGLQCQCPPGTKAYPTGSTFCSSSWRADCNFF